MTDETARKLKLIEVLLTMGGFLGIIIVIQPLEFPAAEFVFSMFLVMFIISAFYAYTSILYRKNKTKVSIWVFSLSASFSGLLTLAAFVPISKQIISLSSVGPSEFYLGLFFLGILMVIGFIFHHLFYSDIVDSLSNE